MLALALGIGANTAIFSAVNAFLLRPLPYREAHRLVRVWATDKQGGSTTDVATYPDFADWVDQSRSFERMAAYAGRFCNLSGGDQPERVRGVRASADLLSLLDIKPSLGRGFLPEEQQPGRSAVVLLTDTLWRRRFNADPKVLGSGVRLNDQNFTVIGVLPARFSFPPDAPAELFVPLEPDPKRGHGFLHVIARLRPGVTLAKAQSEMDTISARLEHAYRADKGRGVNLVELHESYVRGFRKALLIFLGAVGFVVLIACTNVANLFLGRAATRHKEFAVRAALGAGRGRLIRQLLTESMLVGLAGGALGSDAGGVGSTGPGSPGSAKLPRSGSRDG